MDKMCTHILENCCSQLLHPLLILFIFGHFSHSRLHRSRSCRDV